ncbi:hypothetical protein [Pseudonocardia endophytica]|uniref:Uncharacterized protein n=1 Tax=Pseudonocardia endophytica TaxID=401976 RepID=A0A4V2PIT4_PSEEN|nr:hypothetical protein [Pseudonocardia endophytica]TCK25916.1 hypothetical protein EV378_1743 [Pseudonocardia endophytica]
MPQSHGTIRLVTALALGVALLAAVVGNVVATTASERTGEAVAVDAVVVEDARAPARVRVAWTGADGRTGTATAAVPAGTRAGDPRRVWVAPDGSVVAQPPAGAAPWEAALLAAGLGAAVAVAVVVAHLSGRRRARDRALEREWAAVEPVWTGRA